MDIDAILKTLPKHLDALQSVREMILANAVMVGEIPAPTFRESARTRFIADRFTECGLQNISTDEMGNAMGLLNGKIGKRTILVIANMDTPYSESEDHTVTVNQDSISGPAIANNSLGVAALVTLPTIFEKLGISFNDNILFLAHTRSIGLGDLEGFRFFLQNNKLPIHAAICVAGAPLGRMSYASVGMLRASIECSIPRLDWTGLGGNNAIATLNGIITRILSIQLPQEPKTNIILGKIEGGTSFSSMATRAQLGLEVRSEQEGMVDQIERQLNDIVEEIKHETTSEVSLKIVARRSNGGLPFQHPLVRTSHSILEALDTQVQIRPSAGALASLIEKQIPAVTIGLTRGLRSSEKAETIEIDPVYSGLAQTIGLLQAIDEGICDAEDD